MNKIYKLLAVFMLFVALSAGSMTVQADEASVAQIGTTKYTSLETAISQASAGDTIELLSTIDLGETASIVPGKDITIDLNGFTLKAYAFNASGASVVDNSTEKTGILKVTSCVLDEANPQMPIYNGTDGYAFATVTEQVYRKSEMGADTFELIFKPDFGALNDWMAKGSIATKVDIGINIEWTDEEGTANTKQLVYDEEIDYMVKTVYTANSGKAFLLTATGTTSFDNLTITPIVKSELGITWTKTEFDAAIEETGITLDQSELELVAGNTTTLTATVAPSDATDKTVTWTSSDASVATVNETTGVVTGVAAGTATITATTSNGKTATCSVTVESYSTYGLYAFDFDSYTVGTITSGTNLGEGKNSKLQAGNEASVSAVSVAKDGNESDIAIKLTSNAKTSGNALCQIDLGSSFANKKVKINYSIYVDGISSIMDTSAFPAIKDGKSGGVVAYPIKLTATDSGIGKIQYVTSNGNIDIQEYSTNKWYDFTFVLDLDSQTYDLYINNEMKLDGVQLVTDGESSMSCIRYIVFQINSASNSSSSITLDDISVLLPTTSDNE